MPAVVAGGFSTDDMPHAITQRYCVPGDSAGTKSGSYTAIPGMSITVNPDLDCGAIAMFTSRAEQYGDLNERLTMGIALYLDGAMVAETILSPYAKLVYDSELGMYVPYVAAENALLFHGIPSLPAGQHTFAMYFKGAQEFIGQTGIYLSDMSFVVTLFYR
ncbi:MAG: hypothetical protein ACM3X3_11675 [Betaproteobacteria bacterium]